MKDRSIFNYINNTEFLPTFCGIPMTAMTRHKLRGKDGNGKPVDFSDAEWEKITQGVQKFYKQFSGAPLTLQDLLENPAQLRGHHFKLKNGRGMYGGIRATNGALCIIFRAGKGTGKDAQRWMPPNTQVELVPIKKQVNLKA